MTHKKTTYLLTLGAAIFVALFTYTLATSEAEIVPVESDSGLTSEAAAPDDTDGLFRGPGDIVCECQIGFCGGGCGEGFTCVQKSGCCGTCQPN